VCKPVTSQPDKPAKLMPDIQLLCGERATLVLVKNLVVFYPRAQLSLLCTYKVTNSDSPASRVSSLISRGLVLDTSMCRTMAGLHRRDAGRATKTSADHLLPCQLPTLPAILVPCRLDSQRGGRRNRVRRSCLEPSIIRLRLLAAHKNQCRGFSLQRM
jgi:hypothetical protein